MKKWLCIAIAGWIQGCTGTDYVADPPMEVEPRILISPDMAAVEVGASRVFAATYFDRTGTPVAGASVRWSVSDAQIATVDEKGTVRGVRAGQVKLIASVDQTDSDPVVVNIVADSTQVALVRLSPSTAELNPGETLQLLAESRNARGDLLAAGTYAWRSSDSTVVRVDLAGLATALAPGQAHITADAEGVTSNLVRITVRGAERTGTFAPRPNSHYRCTGTAILRPRPAGGLELVFAGDFSVSSGPRLEVFLSAMQSPGPGSINLGALQSNAGAQSYALPEGVELATYDWVIIHCVPFNITFGSAQLR